MPTTPRNGLPYFWVTWLTSILAGEAKCEYAPWFRARNKYDKAPRDLNLTAWQLEHTTMVDAQVAALKADGWNVTVEDQNGFRLTGTTAVLAGKPDVIGRKGARVRIVDCKTGQPSTRDIVQAAIYAVAIPLVWHRSELEVEPAIVYKAYTAEVTPFDVAVVRDRLFALLKKLGTEALASPDTVPSERECNWCDIAVCPDRWIGSAAAPTDVVTELF